MFARLATCCLPLLLAGAVLATAGCVQSRRERGITAPTPEKLSAARLSQAVALPEELPGLHNVFVLDTKVYSGSGPASAEAFDTLAGLGVQTVISVDGARPELEIARERGMRYVHVPIGYDGLEWEQMMALAKAVRDMPGPVYIHCHHGKHRGPAAAAAALVSLGRQTNQEAEAFMALAGTSESYPGLWACVRDARPASEAELALVPDELPEHQAVSGLVDGMVVIDASWERMKLIRAAGWRPPPDHPDVAPAAEAGILADHFRVLAQDPDCEAEGAEFLAMMRDAAERAGALEAVLALGPRDGAVFEEAYLSVAASCTACHDAYRN